MLHVWVVVLGDDCGGDWFGGVVLFFVEDFVGEGLSDGAGSVAVFDFADVDAIVCLYDCVDAFSCHLSPEEAFVFCEA